MAHNISFDHQIPEGWQILFPDNEVVGLTHQIGNAYAFARGKKQGLRLELEPGKNNEPDAIKVMGSYQGWIFMHEFHLGYLPAGVLKMIKETPKVKTLLPRLKNIWVGGDHKLLMIVRFDIMVPIQAEEQKPAE